MGEPFQVYGSVQDHGSYRGEVRLGRGRDRIPAVEFERAPGGEGSDHAIDPTDPDRIVIGWRQFDSIASDFRQAGYAYSHDGGHSWTTPAPATP